ncbi:SET domain containing protein [Rhypophila decipiens]
MTDKLPPLVTPIVPPSQRPISLSTAVSVQDVSHKQEIAEEEPYTIKCICDFVDDDGNTILCEKCNTWQHIECYYPDNMEEAVTESFAHACADCEPRSLNRKRAHERQSLRIVVPVVEAEAADKKVKRPPTKHKKKPKPNELQLNGHPSVPEKHHSPHDHGHAHPPKKPKNSHKPSQSISSQAPKRSPSSGNTKVSQAHPPSPATTPPDLADESELHSYSTSFLSLYDNPDFQITYTNTFARLKVSNTITAWLRDPDLMKQETGFSYDDVFQKLPSDIDSRKRKLEVEHVQKMVSPTLVVHWQRLTTPSAIPKDNPIMELNGEIDFQSAYSAIPSNRWTDLSTPLPFVFFHPILPLYIDTRKEGSAARYVRRSCRPNATIEAFISDGREYHFWLVSDRPIAAHEQITIPWDFRLPKGDAYRILSVLGLGDDDTSAQSDIHIDEAEYQTISLWIHQVLSEYGGCACDLGAECAFARFRRTYPSKAHARPNATKEKSKKPRKPKTQHAISPTSTGHATNSRAASEGHLDDVPEHDGRSVSGSSRSKPPSRDMTPTARQGSFDTLGILTEPTDRDKRKVAMVEDSFRRMEQQHQPPKKRKRLSDGTTSKSKPTKNSSTSTVTPTLPNDFPARHYVDAGTSRSKSGSPTSAHNVVRSKKPISRNGSVPLAPRQISGTPSSKNYKDAAVQTDPEERAWYSETKPTPTPTPRKRILSLSQRLLKNRHITRVDDAVDTPSKKRPTSEESSDVMDMDTTPDRKPLSISPSLEKDAEKLSPVSVASADHSTDVQMGEAPAVSPSVAKAVERLPTTTAVKTNSPELRVTMPPVPPFNSSPSNSAAPLSAGGSTAQSPFSANGLPSPFGPPAVNGIAAAPSPIKKKLSLSDYTKSRMNKGGRPSIGTTSLKPVASSDEPKSAASVASNFNSPTNEKSIEIPAPATGVVSSN